MRRRIKIYYGLSGTLKSTTIKTTQENEVVVKSAIKDWKKRRDKLFPWLTSETNLNYALLHLVRLLDYKEQRSIIIERGVSDMLFYEERISPSKMTDLICHNTIQEELNVLGECEVEKILLIMKDKNFIDTVVLKEPTRKDWFLDSSEYLQEQERYIEFTKKYNKIDNEIVIKDAREYLASLGLEYNV